MKKILFLSCLICFVHIQSNPFEIDYPMKNEYTAEDFIEIENILLEKMEKEFEHYSHSKNLFIRVNKGLNLQMIEPETGSFHPLTLIKIGNGGDNCIVSYASFNPPYKRFIKELPKMLETSGFNGYFLYQIGGFPTPTGEEIKYIGVPYAFKIFMMVEAYKRGFNNVLWLDSAVIPIKNISPLFQWIEEHEVLVTGPKLGKNQRKKRITGLARKSLIDNTGIDVLRGLYYCRAGVFGLKMDSLKGKKFIKEFYELVKIGTPFCSTNPEEWVYMALVQSIFGEEYIHHPFGNIVFINGQDKKPLLDKSFFRHNRLRYHSQRIK